MAQLVQLQEDQSNFYHQKTRSRTTRPGNWENDLVCKFARDNNIVVFPSRQTLPGLLNARGVLCKRETRQTAAQHGPTGKFIQNMAEARALTQANRTQIIYQKQQKLKGGKTEGIQRMKKERRDFENDLVTVNERAAAASTAGVAVNIALKEHTADLIS